MDTLQTTLLVLGIINTVLLLVIITGNIRSYLKVRAQYTLMMMCFAGLFLLQYLASALNFFASQEIYTYGLGTHLLIVTGLQTIGFAAMLWMQRQ